MRFKRLAAVAIGAALAFSFAACGSGNSTPTDTGATTPTDTSAPATTTAPAINYATDVGIVLPTNSESRWPVAYAEFNKVMPGAKVLYSNNDPATEANNVQQMITNKVKVLIICPFDATAAAAEVDQAAAAGIKVISYDRLIMNTKNVSYYATFDSVAVGTAQAQYLIDQAGSTQGNNLYIYTGAATDNNAFLFFQGAWAVLQPKIADGTFVIRNSSQAVSVQGDATLTHDQEAAIIGQTTINWDPTTAQNLAQGNLANATPDQLGTVYLLTPNDDTARPIGDAFRANTNVTTVFTTGQDFTQASLQYILDGKQSMTVWKPDSQLVAACQNIVDFVLSGATSGQPSSIVTSYNNGAADIPSTKGDLTIVTKDNVTDTVNNSGLYTISNGTVNPVS